MTFCSQGPCGIWSHILAPVLCPCPWFGRGSPVPRTQLFGTEVDPLQSWSQEFWVMWHGPLEMVCRCSTMVSSWNIQVTSEAKFLGEGNLDVLLRKLVIRERHVVDVLPEAERRDVTQRDMKMRQFCFCLSAVPFPRDLLSLLLIRVCDICLDPYNKCHFAQASLSGFP